MGLRCFLGHDYGESQVKNTRENRGDEVIVTIREYRECTRCGQQQVISENKEVRSDIQSQSTDVNTEDDTQPTDEPTPDHSGGPFDPEVESMSAEEDDGIILPNEDVDNPPGTESDSEESTDDEPMPWPDTDSETEPSVTPDQSSSNDQSVSANAEYVESTASTDDQMTGGGQQVTSSDSPVGIRSAEPSPDPSGRRRLFTVETEFACPQCGYSVETIGSSLRPGDICPECRRGYLAERER